MYVCVYLGKLGDKRERESGALFYITTREEKREEREKAHGPPPPPPLTPTCPHPSLLSRGRPLEGSKEVWACPYPPPPMLWLLGQAPNPAQNGPAGEVQHPAVLLRRTMSDLSFEKFAMELAHILTVLAFIVEVLVLFLWL